MTTDHFIQFGGPDVRFEEADRAAVIVLPIYYEMAPSYGAGSGRGADHILRASLELECMDEETLADWGGIGIHTASVLAPSADADTALQQIRQTASKYMGTGGFLLSVGGDHAVTIGLAAAAAEAFEDVGLLQIDAHLDLRDQYNGSRNNHACVMRRVAEDMKLPFVQVGIRSVAPEEGAYIREKGLRPFFAHDLDASDNGWMDEAIDRLPENVYLSLDLDGLDPSVVPGTGTPEPGGLTYRQVVGLIRKLGARRRVVAADINELAKIEGSQVSEFAAAKLAAKIIVYCAMGERARKPIPTPTPTPKKPSAAK
ncbi:MAG: agmatinase [Thermodesulfobacteriota bacterium]